MASRHPRRLAEAWADLGHAVAGVTISALGLAVALAVGWTGSAPAEARAEPELRVSQAHQAAVPLPSAQDIDPEPRTGRPGIGRQSDREDGTGTLERYSPPHRYTPDGPHPLRQELQKGRALLQEKELRRQVDEQSQGVSETSRDRLGRSRAADQQSGQEAITAEQERLEEEQRQREEEERRLAEELAESLARGTLVDGEYEGPYTGPVVGTTSGAGGSAPVAGQYTVSARWGAVGAWSRYHTGIDLSAPIGRPVLAAADGVVQRPAAGGWAGIHVIIQHPGGDATLYAHLASTTVRPGQSVRAGEVIGSIGMTGRTFGPHLHFEYYPSASSAANPYSTSDPYVWMLTRGVRL